MISSNSKAIFVLSGLPGPPSGHGDPRYTLSSNAGVEHINHMESGIKNHTPSKNQMSNQGAQRVITTFARQGHDRQRLKNELVFEIKRVRVVQKRLKRQNLEIEKMRELMKARHELEVLESQQRLAKIYQELKEVRDRVSRLKAQQYLPLYKTTSHAPTGRKPINLLSCPNNERNCIVNPRAKVLPRNVEPGS